MIKRLVRLFLFVLNKTLNVFCKDTSKLGKTYLPTRKFAAVLILDDLAYPSIARAGKACVEVQSMKNNLACTLYRGQAR